MPNCIDCKNIYGTIFSCKKCLSKLDDYITRDCVKYLDISNIPTEIITETNFSFHDIAMDVAKLRDKCIRNPLIQKFIQNPLIYDPILVNKANLILQNICLNFINDPQNPPPEEYVKRATIIATDGDVIVDVVTYVPNPKGTQLGFNFDRNIAFLSSYYNIVDASQNPDSPIYQVNSALPNSSPFLNRDLYWNPNNINTTNISKNPKGLKNTDQHIILNSKKNYTYPADEINPKPTGGKALNFQVIPNHGGRQEVIEAIIQRWGFSSRRSPTINNLPSYYVANNISQKDGYSLILRISYINYK